MGGGISRANFESSDGTEHIKINFLFKIHLTNDGINETKQKIAQSLI